MNEQDGIFERRNELKSVFWIFAGVLIAITLLFPGDAPWINDEPILTYMAFTSNQQGISPSHGMYGSIGTPYGPLPIWFYKCFLFFSKDLIFITLLKALLTLFVFVFAHFVGRLFSNTNINCIAAMPDKINRYSPAVMVRGLSFLHGLPYSYSPDIDANRNTVLHLFNFTRMEVAFNTFEKYIFADNCFFMFFNTLRKTRFDQIRRLAGKLDNQ
jgi:hypothetical protein